MSEPQNLHDALRELLKTPEQQKNVLISIYKGQNTHICSWNLKPSRDLRLQILSLLSEAQIIIPNYLQDPVVSIDTSDGSDQYSIIRNIHIQHQD